MEQAPSFFTVMATGQLESGEVSQTRADLCGHAFVVLRMPSRTRDQLRRQMRAWRAEAEAADRRARRSARAVARLRRGVLQV
jgi:hypothetical protein